MHRIEHPVRPDCMEPHFLKENGIEDWDQLRAAWAGKLYKEVKSILVENQHRICAYCESPLSCRDDDIRVEHFHPKSDKNANWGLDWDNIMAVCCKDAMEDGRCDVGKQRVQQGTVKVDGVPAVAAIEGYILNPYEMPQANLFLFSQESGKLDPNCSACGKAYVRGNKFGSVVELVDRTISVLNLNCDRLCRVRRSVAAEFDKIRAKLRKQGFEKSIRGEVAERWFGGGRVLSYFTTRRCLLKGRAEKYISARVQSTMFGAVVTKA